MYDCLAFIFGGLIALTAIVIFFAIAFPQVSVGFFTYMATQLNGFIKKGEDKV